MRKKIEENFWDMEIIGNRRKSKFDLPSLEKYMERDSVEKLVFVVLIEKIWVNLGLRMFVYIR